MKSFLIFNFGRWCSTLEKNRQIISVRKKGKKGFRKRLFLPIRVITDQQQWSRWWGPSGANSGIDNYSFSTPRSKSAKNWPTEAQASFTLRTKRIPTGIFRCQPSFSKWWLLHSRNPKLQLWGQIWHLENRTVTEIREVAILKTFQA